MKYSDESLSEKDLILLSALMGLYKFKCGESKSHYPNSTVFHFKVGSNLNTVTVPNELVRYLEDQSI